MTSCPTATRNASLACLILTLMLVTACPCRATIYKYQKNGVWYYTDTPPENMPGTSEQITESDPHTPVPTVGGTPLLADFPVKNDIEKAASATVAVQSPITPGQWPACPRVSPFSWRTIRNFIFAWSP